MTEYIEQREVFQTAVRKTTFSFPWHFVDTFFQKVNCVFCTGAFLSAWLFPIELGDEASGVFPE